MATTKPAKPKAKPSPAPVKKASTFNWELYLNWLVFGLYTFLILYTVSSHEPWRDEAQSWMVARDNSLLGLLQYLPNEGHPPLWYLIQMPFAKMGVSYNALGYIHAVIVLTCAWFVLFRSGLPVYLRIALIFSYYFFYEYADIARNYSIVGLILFAIVALYDQRFKKPILFGALVFLLLQTHVLAFCVGAGIGLVYLIEIIQEKRFNAKNFIGLGIMAIGGLAVIALFLSAGLKSSHTKAAEDKVATLIMTYGNALLLDKKSVWGLIFFGLLMVPLIRKPKALLMLAVGLAGFTYLVTFEYQGTLRHHGLALTFLAFAYAIAYRYEAIEKLKQVKWLETGGAVLFTLILSVQAIKGFGFVKQDWEKNFSDAKNAGEFLNRSGLSNYTIVGHRCYAASAVAPYLPDNKPIYYADLQRYGTYIYFDSVFFENYLKYSADYAPYIVQEKFKNLDSVVLLMNMPIEHPQFVNQWDLVYRSFEQPAHGDEAFFIYKHRASL